MSEDVGRELSVTLLTPKDIEGVKTKLAEEFGTSADDDKAENPVFDDFMGNMDDLNFYDYMALMKADPDQEITTWRSYAKVVMLPLIQCVAPMILIWHELPHGTISLAKDLSKQGLCPDNEGYYFRGLGFVLIVYAVWQIVDMGVEGPTIQLSRMAARHYAITTMTPNITFTWGFWTQWFCGILIECTLFILLCGSNDPMDIVMNCVALNFLLGVDNEWVTDVNKTKGKKAAEYVFKDWRDSAEKYEDKIRKGLKSSSQFNRKHAEQIIVGAMIAATYITSFFGHALAIFFFFCDGAW